MEVNIGANLPALKASSAKKRDLCRLTILKCFASAGATMQTILDYYALRTIATLQIKHWDEVSVKKDDL